MNFISDFQFQISVRRRESECGGSGSGDDNGAKKFPAFFAAFFPKKKTLHYSSEASYIHAGPPKSRDLTQNNLELATCKYIFASKTMDIPPPSCSPYILFILNLPHSLSLPVSPFDQKPVEAD